MNNNSNNSIYFWQESIWAKLVSAWEKGRLAHGLLLAGPAGMGKLHFAREFSHFVMCRETHGSRRPCGQCKGCLLMKAGSHPDFRWESVPEDRRTIGIDQAREIVAWMRLTSFQSGYKVVLVDDADLLTPDAANSLLKTLEEPSGDALLMLVSKRPNTLLATMRSRCQKVGFVRPKRTDALRWLETQDEDADWSRLLFLASGAPLEALAMHKAGFADQDRRFSEDLAGVISGSKDPVAISTRWNKLPAQVWQEWLQTVVMGLIRVRVAGPAESPECEPVHLIHGSVNINLCSLYRYLDELVAVRKGSETGGLRPELMAAAMLIPWSCGMQYRSIYQEL